MKFSKQQKIFAVVILLVPTFVFFLQFSNVEKKITSSGEIESYAKSLVEECADESYRPYCYEQAVPRLLGKISTAESFDLIRELRKQDPEYVFCHVLAHEIGQYEVALDPDNWLDAFAKGPIDGLCSNGYAHGAILARFNEEYFTPEQLEAIKPELSIACEPRAGWNPTELQKAMCYHGMGHVLVHLTDADVNRAIIACQTVAQSSNGKNFYDVCYEGVYMQLFQPLEPEDEALINKLDFTPDRENIVKFCETNSTSETEFGVCWREAWPLFGNELETGSGTDDYCGYLTNATDKDRCYISVITINARHNLGKNDKLKAICDDLDESYTNECYARSANAYLEEDQNLVGEGVAFCAMADDVSVQNYCYQFLADLAAFNFHPGSTAYNELCYTLPKEMSSFCRVN